MKRNPESGRTRSRPQESRAPASEGQDARHLEAVPLGLQPWAPGLSGLCASQGVRAGTLLAGDEAGHARARRPGAGRSRGWHRCQGPSPPPRPTSPCGKHVARLGAQGEGQPRKSGMGLTDIWETCRKEFGVLVGKPSAPLEPGSSLPPPLSPLECPVRCMQIIAGQSSTS